MVQLICVVKCALTDTCEKFHPCLPLRTDTVVFLTYAVACTFTHLYFLSTFKLILTLLSTFFRYMYDSITGRRNTRPRTPPDEWRGEMAHFDPTTLGHITEVNKNAGASFDMGGGFIPAPAHEDRHEDAPYAEYVYVNRLFIGVNRFSGPPRGRTVRRVR